MLTPLQTTESNSHLQPQETWDTPLSGNYSKPPLPQDVPNTLVITEFSAEKLKTLLKIYKNGLGTKLIYENLCKYFPMD